jgi:hypothetical protein
MVDINSIKKLTFFLFDFCCCWLYYCNKIKGGKEGLAIKGTGKRLNKETGKKNYAFTLSFKALDRNLVLFYVLCCLFGSD